MLCAIDTSTAVTGLACYDEHGLRGECAWHSGRNHTAQVLPQLDMLLRHIGRDRTDIAAVGVALGPGSWSGLRVGLSIAKGLASAGSMTLLGIPTLDVLAHQYQHDSIPVCPLIRLGRDRFAATLFSRTPTYERISDYRNVSLTELCLGIREQTLFCGDIDDEMKNFLQRELESYATFPLDGSAIRRPGYLASLAWQRFVAGQSDDVASLEPLYLGEPIKVG